MPVPPRFVHASSVAVYGARNPHRNDELLTASTPLQPSDLYGAHKVMAEDCVTTSELDWVVLRLGGVLLAEPRWAVDRDLIFFEAVLPSDGRIQTVDVRDVAHAFCAATVTVNSVLPSPCGLSVTHRRNIPPFSIARGKPRNISPQVRIASSRATLRLGSSVPSVSSSVSPF
jgi:nucleoside-diphosphate-sugar epimerase